MDLLAQPGTSANNSSEHDDSAFSPSLLSPAQPQYGFPGSAQFQPPGHPYQRHSPSAQYPQIPNLLPPPHFGATMKLMRCMHRYRIVSGLYRIASQERCGAPHRIACIAFFDTVYQYRIGKAMRCDAP
ncbi:hypothetical protein PGTUg99_008168 [Puccinia graminis f. sp. tritici]|uniref:Uncharacterized protein n=1 Tax=Puccinia graminis f. sp. tritici TaxID=56615 RepID=A0A5B0P359_PUCGR|nr:hypothetical protein PGTUg99_008168 [Puccinia graminis f. sp. tritici]